jgi:hypothetical protein
MALSVQSFLDSTTPAQNLIGLSLVLKPADCSLSPTGIRLVQNCPLDDIARKVVAVAKKVLESGFTEEEARAASLSGSNARKYELAVRHAGRQVVATLGECYRATDEMVHSVAVAEHGCNSCQENGRAKGQVIDEENGIPSDCMCEGCNTFLRNIEASREIGDFFKKRNNSLFLGYTQDRFIATFQGAFQTDSRGRLTHPDADAVSPDKNRVIATERSLSWLARQP